MNFSYKAINAAGKRVSGQMEAAQTAELEQRLKSLGLDLITAAPETGSRRRAGAFSRRDLMTFTMHMELVTRAGVPLLEGLADLRDPSQHPAFNAIAADLLRAIEGGRTLSQAMAEHPRSFDEVYVSLVRAGEETGQLPRVFANLSASLKWLDEIVAQTKKALMYPAFVMLVVGGVVGFLMVYLVPQLVQFIKSTGQTLPLHTRALLATSDAIVHYWWLILSLPFAALGLHAFLLRSTAYRLAADRGKLRLPLIGPILQKVALARLASYFALTYRAGLPILEGLRLCATVVGNRHIAQGVEQARQRVLEGQGIGPAFNSTGLFPPLVMRMIKAGESTGALDEALENVSYFYDREVKEGIARLQGLIEPLLTVTLGLILGWIMFSVLGPIYDSITALSGARR
jgi:type IV pilus assembly protein PilC